MATSHNNSNILLNTLLILVFLILMISGYGIIVQSNDIYKQSYNQSEVVTKKVIDSSFKKSVTIPAPSYTIIKDGYGQALSFFTLALGALFLILLLPRLQNFSISTTGINITLKELQSDVDSLKTQNNALQEKLVDTGGGKPITVDELKVIKLQVL